MTSPRGVKNIRRKPVEYNDKLAEWISANPAGKIILIDGENLLNHFDKLHLSDDTFNVIFMRRWVYNRFIKTEEKIPQFRYVIRTESISAKRDSTDIAIIVECTLLVAKGYHVTIVTRDHFAKELQKQLEIHDLSCDISRVDIYDEDRYNDSVTWSCAIL